MEAKVFEELVKKSQWVFNAKKKCKQRKSPITKNEQYRQMLLACQRNQIQFRYVLNDVWYASSDNMRFIHDELEKHFIMPVKSNRKVALSKEDKAQGCYQQVATLELEPDTVKEVYVEQVEFPLKLCKQVFKNGDGSEGVLYLVSNDVTLDDEQMTTIYKRRWNVETYHKSLKCNTALAKSPTKTMRTQSNHCFASIYAFVKLERMKQTTKLNHFALRSKIYLKALQAAKR